MTKPVYWFLLITLLVMGCTTDTKGQNNASLEERKERIVGNLKLQIPQLREREIEVNTIEASPLKGFDQGSISIEQVPGEQKFLVTTDDTYLILLATDPIDISRSMAEVNDSLAKVDEQLAAMEQQRHQQLLETVEDRPVRGNAGAPITIVEFSDFQCPYCGRANTTMRQLLDTYPQDVRLVYLHLPLSNHDWAQPAAIATECAAQQSEDAFWTLHDAYFQQRRELTTQNIIERSKMVLDGIDEQKWLTCVQDPSSEAHKSAVQNVESDMQLAQNYGINGTPGFLVNGRLISGAQPYEAFEKVIQEIKSEN